MTRRRWRIVLGVLLVLRLALPPVARRVMESQASSLLQARVTIGDVDFALWRGVVALEDVAVRPPAAAAGDEAAPADTEPALIAWKRFAVNLAWFPLLWKTVRFQSIELDDPHVALDRLAHGEINLLALVPKSEAAPPPAEGEPATEKSGWGVGVDRLALRTGHVRFRDFAVEGAEPIDLALPNIEVKDVALSPGLYGEPANARLDVRVDRGRLRVNTRVRLLENGLEATTNLRARRLPLRRTRLYVPDVGWRELGGELGASLVHRFASGGRHDVRGTVTLDDVAVNIPELATPALTWRHLGVALDRIDVVAQRAAVASVELAGVVVAVRPRGGPPLPVVGAGTKPSSPPAAAPEPSPPATRPWHWSVGTLRVTESAAHVLSEPPQDVAIEMEAHRLAGEGDETAPVKLTLGLGDGTLALDGALRIARPGFAGTLAMERLALPHLAGVAGALPPDVLQKGTLGANLEIAVGSSAPTPGDVRVAGKITIDEPWMAAADARDFAAGWSGLEVGIDELLVPGALAEAGSAPSVTPITVRLSSISLAKPYVQLTRTDAGIVLPPLSSTPPEAASPAEPAPPSPPAVSPRAAPADAKAATPVDVAVDSLRLTEGRIFVTDRTVKPFFAGGLSPLEIEVKKLRWPALAMERVRVEATSATRGKLLVAGGFSPAGGQIDVNGKDIALQPFNPYAISYSPYSIASGALTVSTKARFAKGRYDTKTAVKLQRFDLGGKEGDTLFAQQFGIPLTVALALLKDLQGNIGIDVPLAADEKGMKVGLASVAGQALRKALIGALASPLKLVGAAFGGGGGEGLAPMPIAFRAGRAEPTPEAEKQVEALAGFLASRPGVGLTLGAPPSATDVRWLREQALREEFAGRQGVFGAVRNLPQRGARDRVRAALEARANDEKGELAGEDAENLERWLAERPAPDADRLRTLSAERMTRLRALLAERYGVGAERVAVRDPSAEVGEGAPAVHFDIGAAAAPAGAR